MNTACWDGFEKRAYDYAHEARVMERGFSARQHADPMDGKRSALIGAGGGAVGGAILGAIHGKGMGRPLVGALLGTLLGGGAGAGTGALVAMIDHMGIQQAKKVMAMPKGERLDYLKAMARDGEISSQQAHDFANAHMVSSALRASSAPRQEGPGAPAPKHEPIMPTGNCPQCGSTKVKKTMMGWACQHCGSGR